MNTLSPSYCFSPALTDISFISEKTNVNDIYSNWNYLSSDLISLIYQFFDTFELLIQFSILITIGAKH